MFPSHPYHPLDLVDLGTHLLPVDLEDLGDLVDLNRLVTLDVLYLQQGQEYPSLEDQGLPCHQTGLVILVAPATQGGLVDLGGLDHSFQVCLVDQEDPEGR